MIHAPDDFTPADEGLHRFDPEQWSWNESWFFSFIDLDGGPAGFFRLGVLPNQRRAMLWFFVNVDGRWFGLDQSRLALDDLDLEMGAAYDKWALRFAWHPDPPLQGGRFVFEASCPARPDASTAGTAVTYAPISIDFACTATGPCFGTVHGDEQESTYRRSRFEQSLRATGTVTVGDTSYAVQAGAHRDRSWGPRDWRIAFTMGDVQSGDRQLYFVGAPGLANGGYIREPSGGLTNLTGVDSTLGYDDEAATIVPGLLRFETPDGERIEVEIAPVGTSVPFDMAHTCEEPETWLYYRTFIEARVSGWDGTARGWLDASRYGIA